jgi:hypothetical protein
MSTIDLISDAHQEFNSTDEVNETNVNQITGVVAKLLIKFVRIKLCEGVI